MCIECCGGKCAAEAVLCGIDRRSGSQGGRAAAAQIVKNGAPAVFADCAEERMTAICVRKRKAAGQPEFSGFGMGFRLSERPIRETASGAD